MSTLPVRSPLPNSVPSTRSAPAISPSSAVATAVPRSLCGCTERIGRVPEREVAPEPLHPVGVDVRRKLLDRGRQVHDHLLRRRRPPLRGHPLADLDGVVELRVVEALRRVLEDDLCRGLLREALAEPRPADREVGDALTVHAEDHPALRHGRRVVEVDDRPPGAVDRLVGALDQLGPRLGEHRDRDVVGDQLLLDERPHEVEVRLRRRREADLDLLDPERDEEVEEPSLPARIHGIDERLVAVAEVGRAPDRRLLEHDVRPGAVGQRDGLVGTVFLKRHRHRVVDIACSAPLEDGLLPLCAGARVRVCRRSNPLAGKEEGKREQAEIGRPIDTRLAEHRSSTIPETGDRDNARRVNRAAL